MYSLANYKEQCYNPGSPNLAPAKSPLKSLPKVNITENFIFSPSQSSKVSPVKSKIDIRDRKCKRKLISSAEAITEPIINSPKKPKMEDLKEFAICTLTGAIFSAAAFALRQRLSKKEDPLAAEFKLRRYRPF